MSTTAEFFDPLAWAGHSDLSFTKRVYVHPDPESLRVGSDKLGELLD